jgi:hypothetical protein
MNGKNFECQAQIFYNDDRETKEDHSRMPFLFISSTEDRAGRSLITWVLARRLAERGLRVGFMKPFGTNPVFMDGQWVDHDAVLIKEVLKLQEPVDQICPFLVSEEGWKGKTDEDMAEELQSLARGLSREKDIFMIMGSRHIFFDEPSCPIPDVALITTLNADLLLINRVRNTSRSVYSILFAKSMLRDRIKGVILNRIPPERMHEVQNHMIPTLINKEIPVTAVLAENPALSYRSLGEIREILEGEVLCGKGELTRPVGSVTVGTTDLRGELVLFKRVYNKVILLIPFSLDKEMKAQAACRSVAGILLTGGRRPADPILKAAERNDVPLILVEGDTFSTMERLEASPPRISARDEAKARILTDLMDQGGQLEAFVQTLMPPA